jgi:tRNA(fMet)-specific endonuclease VapC
MILLDTDILTYSFAGHPRVAERMSVAPEPPVISVVSRIEVLKGRFDSVLKAADREQLLTAQTRLDAADRELAKYTVVPFDAAAAAEFERLVKNRKLKSIGRGDMLIASIALANHATLISRNLRDFREVPGLRLENWAD